MRESTRDRYERLRKERAQARWRSPHRRRLLGGGALLVLGVLLLALALRGGAPSEQLAPMPTAGQAQRGTSAPLRASALPVGGGAVDAPLPTIASAPAQVPLLLDDWRMTSEPGLTIAALQELLDGFSGSLKSAEFAIGDHTQSFAEILVGQTALYSLNPKLVLVLLEVQQRLLSDPEPASERLAWAMGYHGEEGRWQGLVAQTRWAVRELHRGMRDYLTAIELVFADESRAPIPGGLNIASYAVLRVLAQSTTPERLPQLLGDGNGSFLRTYSDLFGDPREPLGELPAPSGPFLSYPLDQRRQITSFFDHELPFLSQNGTLVSYWGRREEQLSYDGHDGWDYAGIMGGTTLAAAPGTVLFAGNSDDGCGVPARGVIIEHDNGYRTLYWHLGSIDVAAGEQVERGQPLGQVGASGCATGPHLHFQVQHLGRDTDPYGWCGDPAADPWGAHPAGAPSRWLWLDAIDPCNPARELVMVLSGGEGFSATGLWEEAPVGVLGGSRWTISQLPLTVSLQLRQDATATALAQAVEDGEPTPSPEASPAPTATPQLPSTATWRPALSAAGRYRVLAYIPYIYNGFEESTSVRYTIGHAGGTSEMLVDQRAHANDWADLGSYDFDPLASPFVRLTNLAEREQESVWAGAIVWVPVE